MAEFQHVDQHGCRGQPADPGDSHQSAYALFESAALFGDLCDGVVKRLNIGADILNPVAELLLDEWVLRSR